MPGWNNSPRRKQLPPNWTPIRKRILARDHHQCTWTDHGQRCTERATDVDHIVQGDDHSDSNLRSLCSHHHQAKSSSEGGRASAKKRTKRKGEREQTPLLIKRTRTRPDHEE